MLMQGFCYVLSIVIDSGFSYHGTKVFVVFIEKFVKCFVDVSDVLHIAR